MAAVGGRPRAAGDRRDGRSRGQLLLVGGLALAVALLVLAVVLNAAIYTENLATRDRASAPSAAADLRWDVVDGVGGIVEYENRARAGEAYATVYGSYDEAVGNWSPMLARHVAVRGASAAVSPVSGMEGTRIVDDNTTTAFTPANTTIAVDALGGSYGEPNWLVATNDSVRGFALIDIDPSVSASEGDPNVTGAFFVEFRNAPDEPTWQVSVYEDDGSGRLNVTVYDAANDDLVGTCSTDGANATVDITGATLERQHCAPLAVLAGLDEAVDVYFVNADDAIGGYELVVDSAAGPLKDAVDAANYGLHCAGPTYEDDQSEELPYATAAIYAATVEMRYDDRSLTYESGVRVAPGEPGDAPSSPVVTEFAVTDASAGGDAEFQVDWTTTDPDTDPADLDVEVRLDGSVAATGSASGTATVTDAGGEGGTYEITLVASDDAGNGRSATETHVADGDDDTTDCPA